MSLTWKLKEMKMKMKITNFIKIININKYFEFYKNKKNIKSKGKHTQFITF